MRSKKELVSHLKAIIDSAIDGIITIDKYGKIESINPAGSRIFGYDQGELIGKKINSLMPLPDSANHDDYINRYLETQEAKIIGIGREVLGKRKDGTIFPFRLAVSKITIDKRTVFTGIIHDLSDIKEAQARLEKLNARLENKVKERTDELELTINKLLQTNAALKDKEQELKESLSKEKELNELKSKFVSTASHEFRTPLSTIKSSASLIAKYRTEAEQDKREKHVKRINASITYLTGILNDILSLSKIEEGKEKVRLKKIRIEDICQEVVAGLSGLLRTDQNIQLKNNTNRDDIVSDPSIFKNILSNLLSNAIKYSPDGEDVYCVLESTPDSTILRVRDKGIGIPKEDQKHLFKRFYRASNAGNIQGTGLGLSIVKRYTSLLDGQLKYTSRENEGSEFTIILPRKTLKE